jgi:hypothetical protein
MYCKIHVGKISCSVLVLAVLVRGLGLRSGRRRLSEWNDYIHRSSLLEHLAASGASGAGGQSRGDPMGIHDSHLHFGWLDGAVDVFLSVNDNKRNNADCRLFHDGSDRCQ